MAIDRKKFPEDLEYEAISIMREAAAQFERPAILFSGGKDSITLVRLAEKAFYPGPFYFFYHQPLTRWGNPRQKKTMS